MTILVYSPFNARARDVESVMIALNNAGHRVISLSQAEGSDIHAFLGARGIETFSNVVHGSGLRKVLSQVLFLVKFCRRHNVDVVFSHLEPANFIAVLAQYFMRARVFVFRHHINEAALYGFDRTISYKLTYALARKIIVVSAAAVRYCVEKERIAVGRIVHINLGYDFSLFDYSQQGGALRQRFNADLVLLTVCRLTEYKRPADSIRVLHKLHAAGVRAKLIILGRGPLESKLKSLATELKVEHHTIFGGHVQNVLDNMAASDFLLHPSVLESSCVVTKEAALVGLPVVVVTGVGDFDTYIRNEVNGFLVKEKNFVDEATAVILRWSHDKDALKQVGSGLVRDIRLIFDIQAVMPEYKKLLGEY